jgi:Domain of unknown function (DUF4347)/Bacterial Ig domain/Calx-beta domain/FG-GAP-like repeat
LGVAIVEFNPSSTAFDLHRWTANGTLPGLDAALPMSHAAAGPLSTTLVFVDGRVGDRDRLLTGLVANAEVHILDPLQDAVSQITQTLLGRSGITSLHIVSHGSDGQVQFGGGSLTGANLGTYASALSSWATALAPTADILLYGCDIAETTAGQTLIQGIAALTGADVAASDDLTGRGGDWELEFQVGAIDTPLAFQSDALAAYNGTLLTTIGTLATWNGIQNTATFGENSNPAATPTFGQTFTAPTVDSILTDFTVSIDDTGGPDVIDFAAYIMAWDGTKATGPILYQSASQSTTGGTGFETFRFTTGNLRLQAGQQYVAFISASSFFDGLAGTGTVGSIGTDDYAGGSFVFLNNGSTFGQVTTSNWSTLLSAPDLAFSATFTSNTAPTLTSPTVTLGSATEDTGAPTGAVGTPVNQIVRLAGPTANVSDPDAGAVTGVAILGANTTNGQWYYTIDGGANWSTLGSVSPPAARLLAADANTRLYFQPTANFSGTVTDGLTFRAWDRSTGVSGSTADTTTAGGRSAFSLDIGTAAIAVQDVNDAPTISAIAPQTLTEDAPAGPIIVNISDIETPAANLVLSATSTNEDLFPTGSVTFGGTGNARNMTLAPAANAFGNAIITLNVFDGTTTTATSFSVRVNPINDAPTLTPTILNQTMTEDTPLPLAFTISDVETQPNALLVEATSSNTSLFSSTGLVIGGTGNNRTLTLTPAANASGTAVITLSVSDGTVSTLQTFSVNVAAVNDAPTVSVIANQAIDEDTPLGPLGFTLSDVETPATALTLSAASSNPSVIADSSIVLTGTGANRAIALNPVANASGTATITLSVSDGVNTTLRSFDVVVNPVNDAPTLTPLISDQSVDEDIALPIAFTIGDVETPIANLVVTATSSNTALFSPAGISLSGTGAERSLLLTPTANANGSAAITLSVSDGTTTTLQTFGVRVNAVNDAPTITPVANQTVAEDGTIGPLVVTINDLETPASALTLSATSSNGTLIPASSITLGGTDSNRTVTINPAANLDGTATITLAVSDGTLAATTSFDITVQPANDAPVLTPGGILALPAIDEDSLPLGEPISALLKSATGTSIVTDADTNALQGVAITNVDSTNGRWQFSIDAGANWVELDTVTPATARLLAVEPDNRIRFIPAANYNGGATLAFRAWDQTTGTSGLTLDTTINGGTTAFSTTIATASVAVLPVNDAPILSPIRLTLNEDAGLTFTDTDFTRSYTDADGTPLATVVVLSLPANGRLSLGGAAVSLNQTLAAASLSGLTYTPAPDYFGADSFTWNASDGTTLATLPATVSLTVNPVNDAPSFTLATTRQTVTAGDPAQTVANFAANLNLGPFNEAAQTLASYLVTTDRPDLFVVPPSLDVTGTLTYTPALPATVTAPGVATVVIRARDSGGTANGGVDLSTPQTLTIAVNPQPLISISNNAANPLSLREGNRGVTPFTFTVAMSVASTQTVRVGYSTVDVSARAASGDYTSISDTLTFLPGEVSKTVVVNVTGDRRQEGTEQFLVTLAGAVNASLAVGTSTATGLILNDDFEDAPDFDGDGFKDIFWRNPVTGDNYIWFTNTTRGISVDQALELPSQPNLNWHVVAINDFNGDGLSDLLWRNRATGENYIWLLNGDGVQSAVPLLPTVVDQAWQVAAVNDFNGDGQADILWRQADTPLNVIWYMNGTARSGEAFLQAQPTLPNYVNIVFGGASDFNGDGQIDILVYNKVTNDAAIWLMNGATVGGVVGLTPTVPLAGTGWVVERLADFTNSGPLEILWRNRTTGENQIWDVNSVVNGTATAVESFVLPEVRDLSWQIEGVGDYTGDGFVDILWRNYSSNLNLVWAMNGVSRAEDVNLVAAPSLDWEIQG